MAELTKQYRKWSTANIRTRLRNDRETLMWWEAKQTYSRSSGESRADAIQLYTEHVRTMEAVLASRTHGGCGKAA
jgi:hypothetical protein